MTHTSKRLICYVAASCVGWGAWAAAAPAQACGGFFCNQPAPNQGPPIAQAGENVVFVLDRDPDTGAGKVEAHVQIVYSGEVDKFSWVVPVSSLPTLSVGQDILFQILEPRTRPTFNLSWAMDGTCKDTNPPGAGCMGGSSAAAGASAPGSIPGPGGPVVDVAFHGNVGPYESAVIRSDDAQALESWLTAHQYFVSPEASQIIKQYVDTGSYFVALRLQMGREVSEIQPIVLRLNAEEGCLPLKLTAIAATPEMRINVWVLGAGRAVPLNYTEVELNLLKLDWFSGGGNYDKLLGEAANEAAGNAFAVEYAQPTANAVSWFTLPPNASSSLAAALNPADFWNTLQRLGLPLSGRVLQVLRTYIPEPASLMAQGLTEGQFYASLPQSWSFSAAAFAPFNAAAAAADLDVQVLKPMADLRSLFEHHATLTRVATFISPEEMTKDPLFVTNPTLPDLANVHTAMARVLCGDQDYDTCSAPIQVDVPGYGGVRFRPPANTCNSPVQPPPYWRADLDATMPAAWRGWRRDASGPGEVAFDGASKIADALHAHNVAAGEESGCACAVAARRARDPLLGLAVLAVLGTVVLRRRDRR
ncbi:MAG: DUF2330 domain-containing protein [Myxococcales bacterium]